MQQKRFTIHKCYKKLTFFIAFGEFFSTAREAYWLLCVLLLYFATQGLALKILIVFLHIFRIFCNEKLWSIFNFAYFMAASKNERVDWYV